MQDPHTNGGGAFTEERVAAGPPGIGALLNEMLSHVSKLIRGEFDLARAEISENLNRAAYGIGFIVVAVLLTLLALNIFAGAIVAALVEAGLHPSVAALIVGGVLAIIAVGLLLKGIKSLKLSSLAPTRTARNIKRDAAAIKESYNG